ncbi:unnamed protein product [Amoebophrya sp. A25]|nr:unnamed protein product [Amoebophrya sp. A25]|eukprot:GSA25T00011592001.1
MTAAAGASNKANGFSWVGYEDAGDQSGRIALVTGASQGFGLNLAKDLLKHTKIAKVYLACRNELKTRRAICDELSRDSRAEFLRLDLADLASVENCVREVVLALSKVESFVQAGNKIDLLVLNAGCICPAEIQRTKDGFEQTIGVCHLGHFALTARLYAADCLADTCRVVTVASVAHTFSLFGVQVGDLNWRNRRYHFGEAYFQAKLANVLFHKELARRVGNGWAVEQRKNKNTDTSSKMKAICVNPGYGDSGLYRDVPWYVNTFFTRFFSQKIENLAANIFRACCDDNLDSDTYVRPGWFGFYGSPIIGSVSRRAEDPDTAKQLWKESERLTGVKFEI